MNVEIASNQEAREVLRDLPQQILRRGADGTLSALRAGAWVSARVVRCFPWSLPGEWYSIRDEAGEELFLLRSTEELDTASRRALEESLAESGFIFDITAVHSQTEESELRRWEVDTLQGRRVFQTGIEEWPTRLPAGGILLKDVAGDLYRIESPAALDAASRKWIWSFID